jgi:hypothetical protein
MIMLKINRLLQTVLLVMCASSVNATIIVSNMDKDDSYVHQVDNGFWRAMGFTTDTESYSVSDLTIRGYTDGSTSGTAAPIMSLWSSSSNPQPGTMLTTFSATSGFSSTLADIDFTADSTVVLEASTNYWLVYQGSTDGSSKWMHPGTGSDTGTGSILNVNVRFSQNQGVSWTNGGGADMGKFELIGTAVAVPVPATIWLLGFGLVGMISVAKRKAHV